MDEGTVHSDNSENKDLNLAGLILLARFHGVSADMSTLIHEFYEGTGHFNERALLQSAKHLQLKARIVKQPITRLSMVPLPALAICKNSPSFIVAKVEGERVLIHCLIQQRPLTITLEELEKRYEGQLLLVTSRASAAQGLDKFDFTWFIPAVIKYRKILAEVIAASFILQLFALITPLYFQIIMDKVLAYQSITTLNIIIFAMLVTTFFDVGLSALRNYIFSHTTSRIDVELGSRLFRHMLKLPISYFESRRVGETVARVRELENIRNFLTGQALTSIIDLFFSFVFIITMLYYSGWLTLIVMISLPCYAIWSALITPILRRRLNEKFFRSAENQSFLVEVIGGIATVKSMSVEPQTTRKWDNQLSAYVGASFRVMKLANIGQHGVQLIQKLVVVAILWFGAQLVIKGDISVGQLIAFNMLAGQMAAPVVRLAQLWQDFQQVGISVERLGDILNTKTEVPTGRLTLPPVRGRIDFEDVTFRYRPDGNEILKRLSLSVHEGEVIGIVGRSGSGKSTLTKLIQRLYVPEQGKISIDGYDLALADPTWIRRQTGVVLQENQLFNGSISDNIALSDPGIPFEKVVEAAKLAGAHDFIIELQEGYNTQVGEQGVGLSGGQRQRIAIARALVSNPRILILDEATSALDYESEHAIMQNMQAICKNRTVLIIAHRLSTVRHANRIIAMDKGVIVESGTHDELIGRRNGYYAHLYQLQQG